MYGCMEGWKDGWIGSAGKQFTYNMLTGLILIPLLGALILAPMNESTPLQISRVKSIALVTTIVTFAVSMIL